MYKVSQLVLKSSSTHSFFPAHAESSSVSTPHNKKKIRINASVEERKMKYSAASRFHFQNSRAYKMVLPHTKVFFYFKQSAVFSWDLYSVLHRLHPF